MPSAQRASASHRQPWPDSETDYRIDRFASILCNPVRLNRRPTQANCVIQMARRLRYDFGLATSANWRILRRDYRSRPLMNGGNGTDATTELEKQAKAASRLINLRLIFSYRSVRRKQPTLIK